MRQIIEINDLSKKFDREVLSDINFTFREGQTVGLIGKNGAGKTTLIKIVLGFLKPTAGKISVFGKEPRKAAGNIGYLPEKPDYHLLFSGKEYLMTIGLYRQNCWELGKEDVFPILGLFTVIITPLTTLRILRLETNPRIYILLTKSLSRVEYLLGKAFAAIFLDTVFLLALFVLACQFTKVHSEYTWGEALMRMIPIFLILLMTVFLFILLSPLVSKRLYFLAGIAYVILGVNPPEQIPSFLIIPIMQLIRLCYANSGFIFAPELWQGLIFTALFISLAIISFNRREVNYEQK